MKQLTPKLERLERLFEQPCEGIRAYFVLVGPKCPRSVLQKWSENPKCDTLDRLYFVKLELPNRIKITRGRESSKKLVFEVQCG